ncbi:MAG TPA: GNAT family N-acetyltransferase [Acidimicrobiales bacterium]|nr:GNAT family N-acetyltransferase [Acidimicrobiales bacterium]
MTDDHDALLARHLSAWLGAWPPPDGTLQVVASPRRVQPGWDGRVRPLIGVLTTSGGVLSVPPDRLEGARRALGAVTLEDLPGAYPAVAAAVGGPAGRLVEGVFRWTAQPAALPDAGEWRPVGDPVVPPWLHPFGGDVLVTLRHGRYVAGVGLKRHDPTGQEVAVVTEPEARGQGLARRLVAQAARRVAAGGAVVTYLHAPDNHASARVAEASGFPDLGWRVVSLAPA